jgi:hypothetical protein
MVNQKKLNNCYNTLQYAKTYLRQMIHVKNNGVVLCDVTPIVKPHTK